MKGVFFKKVFRLLIHLTLLGLLLASWLPIARVYYQAKIPIGCDASTFAYYVDYFRKNPAFPVSGWRYQAFEGIPRLLDSTWLHFYLIQPLVSWLGFFPAVKIYPLAFHFLFILFAYLLFYEISANFILSAALAFIFSRTGAFYLPLYSSGVVLSSLSQAFFPMVLYFLTRFSQRNEKRSFYLAALALALAMYTHPGTSAMMTLPAVAIFLFFFTNDQVGFFNFKKKIKFSFLFFPLAGLIGALGIWPHFYSRLVEGGHHWLQIDWVVEEKAFSLLAESLNLDFYLVLLAGFFFAPFFLKKINRLVFPFLAIVVYNFVFLLLLRYGRYPYGGVIFPHRIYWAFVSSSLALAAALLSPQITDPSKFRRLLYYLFTYGLGLGLVVISALVPKTKIFRYVEEGYVTGKIWEEVEEIADPGKLYGEKLFLSASGADLSFFAGAGLDYRFYTFDYGQNLSLGMATPLSQARGAFHFANNNNIDWFAWLDAVLSWETQAEKRIAPYVQEKQSLYLLDWYAIRYIFGWPADPGRLALWLSDKESPYVEKRQERGENMMLKIKKEFTSPIAKPSSAKTIGFVGERKAYDFFLRNLGALAYDSEYLVPIYLERRVEEIKKEDLAVLDGLFIYSYREKNKARHLESWDLIAGFAKEGGIVLVETGSRSPEKYLEVLPAVFPVEKITTSFPQARWQVSQKGEIFKEIDFDKLSPLTYEGGSWAVDYADEIRPGASVLLTLEGKPVVAEREIGQGKFIWSGLNFPYRIHYFAENAEEESKIFQSLLDQEFGVAREDLEGFTSQRPRSEKLIVEGRKAKGVLFKENNYGGWSVQAKADGLLEKLKIYPAGLDFMYVRLPENIGQGSFQVIFEYRGTPENWLFFLMTILGMFCLLDGLLLNGRLIERAGIPLVNFLTRSKKGISSWWDKDEER